MKNFRVHLDKFKEQLQKYDSVGEIERRRREVYVEITDFKNLHITESELEQLREQWGLEIKEFPPNTNQIVFKAADGKKW